MRRSLLLITLLVAVSSCDSIDDSVNTRQVEIEAMRWLPGDSLLLALTSVPTTNGYDRDLFIRIYDLNGGVREQFHISFDSYTTRNSLHVSLDGRTALLDESGDLTLVDLATHNKTVVSPNTDVISYAPDRDVCILSRRADNMGFGDGLDTFALATIGPSGITIDTLLQINTGFRFFYEFPLLLSNGRLATLESDSTFSTKMLVRDSYYQVQRVFHLPMTISLTSPKVVFDCPDFFFITDGMTGYSVNRFRTDVGFIDALQELDNYYSTYAVVAGGKKVVFWEARTKRCVLKDIGSGSIIPIPGTEGADGFYLSNDSKHLAVVREGAKLSVVPLP